MITVFALFPLSRLFAGGWSRVYWFLRDGTMGALVVCMAVRLWNYI